MTRRSPRTPTTAAATSWLYEADQIDPRTRTGWSVTVTGLARQVEDPALIARYQQALRPWIAGAMDIVIGIGTDIVTGFELPRPTPATKRLLPSSGIRLWRCGSRCWVPLR